MIKEKAESADRYKEYLAWLKASRMKAAKLQKEYKSAMKALADETAMRHREHLAEYAKWERTLEKEL